jgi:MSHA pilin protein MshD
MSMHPNRSAQRGLTLIELVIFIVIISIALTGVLITFNTVVKSSADPLISRQLQSIAEAMLEEVLMQDFVDPDGSGVEALRASYDNVDDYHGFDSATGGITFPNGDAVAGLADYRVEVSVTTSVGAWGTTHSVPVGSTKLVTVTASRAGQSFSLSGYRSEDPAP